ncbi:MAG: serine/threonine-protein kinase [Myxococcales bacterium]|nr:serine/threonine protein kinase [Myxococcota bacterium]MDW8283000.1 serine/threonine-protein kinase [Myxococcales bacterium]
MAYPVSQNDPAEHPLLGSTIEGYRLLRVAGVGGMGVVFEGRDDQGRRAAIKVLHAEMAQDREVTLRFLNEARAAQIVGHPALVEIWGCGQLASGEPYIVMEFLEGESLASVLAQAGGKLQVRDAVRVARQVAEALAAAHAKDIVHRDLKPENIMLGEDARRTGQVQVKVFDFGLAKMRPEQMTDRGPDATVLKTQSGRLVGTPSYMAPEQCDEDGCPDQRTDVYALGVVLYECLAGRPPFVSHQEGNARIIEVLSMHLGAPPPPLRQLAPHVPAPLAELVHAMLAKEQAKRPSMAEVAQRLLRMERQLDGGHRWLLAAALAVTALLGGGLSWLVLQVLGTD